MPQLPAEPEPPWKATAQALADHPPEVPEPPMLARIVGEHDLGWWCGQMVQAMTWCIKQIQILQSEEKTMDKSVTDLQAALATFQADMTAQLAAITTEVNTLKGAAGQMPADAAAAVEAVATQLDQLDATIKAFPTT